MIHIFFIFDVQHDLRHKAGCVAGGHLTDPCTDSSYSSAISLCSMRIALLAGHLKGLNVQVGDIGNAYLEAHTSEKCGLLQLLNSKILKVIF